MPLGGLNQVHPDVLARSSERPVGPTTETGVPPSTNEPVPPTVPATTVGPMTADAAKKIAGQYYDLAAQKGGTFDAAVHRQVH
jgi:hypothetical protein